ncbi:hypothetical protein GRAN_2275 [Granulicella sibirica]|uniref:Uncharacterized protein n=1 Tax=Granulicella sibirica TaxID=2479048 RepID=A0A4Q0T5D8_9BACT|nr:hypothetical protein GRAN_2275 [Granulicella sibirica]
MQTGVFLSLRNVATSSLFHIEVAISISGCELLTLDRLNKVS